MDSSPSRVRFLLDGADIGPRNMAVDEALLESAAGRGEAAVRIYRWSTPTLSLGYFQRLSDRDGHAASRSCPVVRRRSGGGAILHDLELTYSIALPREKLPTVRASCLYETVHQAWLRALRRIFGIQGTMLECQQPGRADAFLCFERRSPFDVVLDGFKILGSAQRQFRSAILQHGSLLLGRSNFAPELPGLADLVGRPCAPDWIVDAWCQEIACSLNCSLEPARLASEESARVDYLAARYESPDWTARR